jgi:GT2 family glycosyltransferase
MEKGKVSFIIVNWNGEKTIAECLDSVYSQTYKNYEVILLDNHSSDQSLEIIKKNYHVDKLIAFEKNYGFAEANNRGLKHAEGEYLALINNDTVLEKDWLEKAVSVFKDSPDKNLGSVATKIIHYHQRDLIDSAGVEFYGLGACWDYKNLSENAEPVNRRKQVFGPCATAALYKKEVIKKVGFFDPEFFIYFEDTDLSFRLRLFRYTCIYEPQAVSYHYGSRRRIKKNKFFIEFGRRNIEFLFVKNMQGPLFAKYLLSHFLYELALFFFYLSIGRGMSFIKAKKGVLDHLDNLMKKRKELKQKLKKSNRFESLYQTEQHFLRFGLWSLFNKFKKAGWDLSEIHIKSEEP